MHTMVKIGDSVSDIKEGLNAGRWTVGVTRTGKMIGLTAEQFVAPGTGEQAARLGAADHAIGEIHARLAGGERP